MRAARLQKFEAILESDGTSLGWTIARVPFDPAEVWPQRNGLRVAGTIRAAALTSHARAAAPCSFRTSLFRDREGRWFILVTKKTQKEARVARGSAVEIALEPDPQVRPPVETPPELEKLLLEDRSLRRWHQALSPSIRKSIALVVAQPKSAESRERRAELMAERMLLAMDGERVVPPILAAAFNRQPEARRGWQAMTPIQRRGHLLGIFYYRSPESRQKRAQTAIADALRIARKRGGEGDI